MLSHRVRSILPRFASLRNLYSTQTSYDAQSFAYCAVQLRKYDYESFLWVIQLPKALRAAVLALRAFNIEVALIPSNTKAANLQSLRYQWWRDCLNACYQGQPPEHPVLQALAQILQSTHLTRYRLQQLVTVRQQDSQAGATPFATVEDMERYADGTSGQLLYLQLEAADAFNQDAHHTAMHLGKAVGMVRLLQGVPYHASLGRCYLPAHVCAARGVSVGAIRKGQPSEALKDVVLDVASVAKGHLDEARGAYARIPQHARPLMLSSVGVGEYLTALEAHDFDVFSPALQAVATRPTLRASTPCTGSLSLMQRCRQRVVTMQQQREYASKAASTSNPLLRGLLGGIVDAYWARCPTGVTVMNLLSTLAPEADPVFFDHFAFRTFDSIGGIDSLAPTFEHFGYQRRDQLVFQNKHLTAYWFSPPNGDAALPRIFISELQVDALSPAAQEIVRRYTNGLDIGPFSVVGSLTAALPWAAPSAEEFDTVGRESEYAAWTLTNGYALNHTTISVHRLRGLEDIETLNAKLQEAGVRLNTAGGVLKVSPDGGLLQSSTVADSVQFRFADGATRAVPGPYMEFAQRLVLPEFEGVEAVEERHRRDGFEVGNADMIFESTTLAREVTGQQ